MPTPVRGSAGDAVWLEPTLAALLFAGCLVINTGDEWPYLWVIDIVCCAGAAVSFRRPMVGAVLVAAGTAAWLVIPDVVPSASGLAGLISVFAAYRRDLAWKIPLTLGVAGLGYLVLVVRSVPDAILHWRTGLLLLLLLGLAIVGGAQWRQWRRLVDLERTRAESDLDAFRVALARDLHDTVAQTLSSTAMRAHLALAEPDVPETVRDDLSWMASQCRSSAHDLRELLSRLRGMEPSTGAPVASLDTLKQTVQQQAERLREAGFEVETQVSIDQLSAARAQALSAVTIEAANNILRHAEPGTGCTLELADNEGEVEARFTNVAASTAASRTGMGLTGVQERLALLGGDSTHRLDAGTWELRVRLPHGVEWAGTPSAPV